MLPATPTQTITSTQPVATQIQPSTTTPFQPSTTTPFQPSTTTPFQPSTATPFQPSTLAQFQPSALAQFQSSLVFNTPPGHIPIGAVYGNYNSPNHPSSEVSCILSSPLCVCACVCVCACACACACVCVCVCEACPNRRPLIKLSYIADILEWWDEFVQTFLFYW